MDEKGTGGPGVMPADDNDPFSIVPDPVPSIPALEKVPETPEEVSRRRTIRIVAVALVLASAAIAVFVVRRTNHLRKVRELVARASFDGEVDSLKAALDEIAGDRSVGMLGLRARLLASGALEMGETNAGDARALIAKIGPGESVDADLSRVLLALYAGDNGKARELASGFRVEGDAASEVLRARALVARAIGNRQLAVEEATRAESLVPGSPRHLALLALSLSRVGDHGGAIKVLAQANAESSVVSLARAQVLLRRGAFDAADREAASLLKRRARPLIRKDGRI